MTTTTGHPASRIVVSIHDVAPLHLSEARWLLEQLDGMGARPRVLKVIPNEAGSVPVGRDGVLGAVLGAEVARGSEIVVHGYTHRAAGPLRGGDLDRLRARVFAPRDAEFLTLVPHEAGDRIDAACAQLGALGLRPTGFCPPAWLAERTIPGLLRERGFRYLVTFGGLHDLQRGRCLTIPAFGYMGADPAQERLVAVERALVLAVARLLPVVRVFLHPQGAPRSRACAAVLRTLERLLRARTPVTYAALLDA